MSTIGPIIGWLAIFLLFYELCAFMVDRWGPM